MAKYHGSIYALLTATYPQHGWLEWRLESVPQGFWKKSENVMRYLKWVESQLNITSLDQWSSVTLAQLKALGGSCEIGDIPY
jgi:hypothetical protein